MREEENNHQDTKKNFFDFFGALVVDWFLLGRTDPAERLRFVCEKSRGDDRVFEIYYPVFPDSDVSCTRVGGDPWDPLPCCDISPHAIRLASRKTPQRPEPSTERHVSGLIGDSKPFLQDCGKEMGSPFFPKGRDVPRH
jgi:hypothetical protein